MASTSVSEEKEEKDVKERTRRRRRGSERSRGLSGETSQDVKRKPQQATAEEPTKEVFEAEEVF